MQQITNDIMSLNQYSNGKCNEEKLIFISKKIVYKKESKRILILLTVEKVLFTDRIYSYKFLFYTSLGVLTNN